jgi:hypothetical protein
LGEDGSKYDESLQNTSSRPEAVEGASSMSCSSLSSCGANECGPLSESVPSCDMVVDSTEELFPVTRCPILLEDTPFGAMLSIDFDAGLDWSYVEQTEPLTVTEPPGSGIENFPVGIESFALDGFLEAI